MGLMEINASILAGEARFTRDAKGNIVTAWKRFHKRLVPNFEQEVYHTAGSQNIQLYAVVNRSVNFSGYPLVVTEFISRQAFKFNFGYQNYVELFTETQLPKVLHHLKTYCEKRGVSNTWEVLPVYNPLHLREHLGYNPNVSAFLNTSEFILALESIGCTHSLELSNFGMAKTDLHFITPRGTSFTASKKAMTVGGEVSNQSARVDRSYIFYESVLAQRWVA